MEIFKQIAPLKAFLKDLKCREKTLGLVPTMGALHAGHLALFKACRAENKITVGSIFVNPIQFNNQNDLIKYPRSLEQDTELLKSVGCDVLFYPETEEMYPDEPAVSFDFGSLDKTLEGAFRPGHFSGVALVVSKLFNIIQPDHAYFGQKDWQQFAIIQRMTKQLNFDVVLHSIGTLREPDGLALSSRNQRLTAEQREKAIVFYQGLLAAKNALQEGKKLANVKKQVTEIVQQWPEVKLEYFELADSKNLNPLEYVQQSERPILCIAGYVGDVRLIDNMFFE